MKGILTICLFVCTITGICNAQQHSKKMEKDSHNPLLCDPASGICEMPAAKSNPNSQYNPTGTKPIKIVYYTDPICSSCWGIEPQLRKLKLEYGDYLDFQYHMGGLLPDWSYNSGGISKPSDVAHHWDEVSRYYDMPIDGDLWLEDPLPSSYPPSIAFKAAQMQDDQKALVFLRNIREMVFLEKKNITRWEYLGIAAADAGLDTAQLRRDYEGKAKTMFESDLKMGRELGIRGFPTLLLYDEAGNRQIVFGFKPYAQFEEAVLKLHPKAQKNAYDGSWAALFQRYPSLTTREFSELGGQTRDEAEKTLQNLADSGKIIKKTCKNGTIWKVSSR